MKTPPESGIRDDAPSKSATNGAKSAASTASSAKYSSAPPPRTNWFGSAPRVPQRAVEEFTRQLSSLLAAGVPLSRALRILHREASSPVAREQWKTVHDAVVDGAPLAGAMAQHPLTFPRVYVAMVQAGEAGGFLSSVLAQIADFQARSKEMRGKVVAALVYPAVLLTLALAVLAFLMVFFIPRFKSVFLGFGATLPLLTRIIMACSDNVARYGLPFVLVLALGVWWVRTWLRTEPGRRAWQRVVLRLPLIGPLHASYAMARFCRMLGTLLGAGVPLISGLRVASESLGNQTLMDALTTSIERVKRGTALAASLQDCRTLFPATVLEMVSVAEETGRLDQELMRVAAVTETDLDRRLRMAVSLAEPLLLFLIASFIGVIFFGMVLPIFSLQDYIK